MNWGLDNDNDTKHESLHHNPVTDVGPPQSANSSSSEYDTKLEERQDERVNQGVPNDFVIAVSASGKSAMSGTGKTTFGLHAAKKFDNSPGGFDAEEQATLNIEEFASKIAEIPDKSAILYDESQGTPGEGTGLDARRGMKQSTLDAINQILANRNKNLTIVIIAQHLPLLDKRVPMLLDAWCLIRKGPDSPDGPQAVHHRVEMEDYNFANPQIRTPAVEDLAWPALPDDDEDYQTLEQLKEEAKTRNGEDGTGELSKEAQAEIAFNIKQVRDIPWREVPEYSDRLTYSGDYLRRVANEALESE